MSHGNTKKLSPAEQERLDAIAAEELRRDEQQARIAALTKKLREM